MISQAKLAELLHFKPDKGYVLSVYFNANLGELNPDMQKIAAKKLIQEGFEALETRDMDRQEKSDVIANLEKIQEYLQSVLLTTHSFRGLAIFAGPDFWQVYELPHPLRNAIYLDRTPYIRPLMAVLNNYHRLLVALVDRREGILYDYYVGELNEIQRIRDDVPGRVRIAGWAGYGEDKIKRHILDHEHRHYKNVADAIFQFFKAERFEYLVLGCHEAERNVIEQHLHPWIRERIIGWFAAEPDIKLTPIRRILEEVADIEKRYRRQQDEKMIRDLLNEANSHRLGVVGLKASLDMLQSGAVQTLVVEEGWKQSGARCPSCGFMYDEGDRCAYCDTALEPLQDVVDEVVTYAIDAGVFVHHVQPDSLPDEFPHIGALLRFRPAEKETAAA